MSDRMRCGHLAAFFLLCGLAILTLGVSPRSAYAQNAEKDVLAVVQKLFDGMRTRDTAAMRSVFDPTARLMRVVRNAPGTVQVTSADQFIRTIAGFQNAELNERIYRPEVRIDGDFATVWTFYTLHIGERFSHCGVDAFQLFRLPQGWKIVSIADTQRTENCDPGGPI
jgi:hypothetical protein